MTDAWKNLLRQQKGLITAAQARELGVPAATLHRRTRGSRPTWQKVLPRVYATFPHGLTDEQRTVAAWLYGGKGAVVTGAAALHWRHVSYLPSEVRAQPVDIVLPVARECSSTQFVRVARTRRPVTAFVFDSVACAALSRATVDAASRLDTHDAVLALVAAVLNAERITLEDLAVELTSTSGCRLLRHVLHEAARNVRSVPEAELLRLLDSTALPPPAVNERLVVDGRTFVPDFRWGWLIIEVESRLHHLLRPGSWEATQRRRAFLQAAGYHVVPVTPEMIRDEPAGVLALIIDAYVQHAAG